ncbi:uncharacterized protein LOC123550144 isoform X2 [Mercenaria mercenaria]|uniref:uncharacterized protein LOC123550144 isoform X2 n=1 Tax=Mercenaria mercenaria TaxID=6596 RepID=UPI00234E54E6|nr:uncharacterized protein LOC123550144 isoform X2 [Mercenaria mercenaria]
MEGAETNFEGNEADLEKDIDTTKAIQCVDKENVLTADDFCKELRIYKKKNGMSQKQERLCNFAKGHIIEENKIYPLTDVKLTIDFSFEGTNNITIIKGSGKQKIRAWYDDKDEPRFIWEKISTWRRFRVYVSSFKFTDHISDKVTISFQNGLNALQNALTAANSFILTKTVLNSKEDKLHDEAKDIITDQSGSRSGFGEEDSEQMSRDEDREGKDQPKKQVTNKGNQKELSRNKRSSDGIKVKVSDKNEPERGSREADSEEISEDENEGADNESKKRVRNKVNKGGVSGNKKSKL